MLALNEITVNSPIQKDPLLLGITLHLPSNHFAAIVGPSGCGKSTLLKVIAGILPHDSGTIQWRQQDVVEHDLTPNELGYVPQFSISQKSLTVEENIYYSARLRTSGSPSEIREIVERVQEDTRLTELRDRRAGVLSGGQLRRLALAMELTTDPNLLLADEVTSGLDPKSEEEVTILLTELSKRKGRLVVLVTHSLRFLDQYNSVTVLTNGRVAYSASPSGISSYFNCSSPEDIYPTLMKESAALWSENWLISPARLDLYHEADENLFSKQDIPSEKVTTNIPGLWLQVSIWFFRRLKLFFRDRTQALLQFTLLFVFPLIVTLFAYQGLPAIRNMSMNLETNVVQQLSETLAFTIQSSRVGTLVSGLAIFQIILLALMGSNNSAREVVGQRVLLEKEKLSGLRPEAVLIGLMLFLTFLVFLQAAWMTLFVKVICKLPGDFLNQFFPFFLLNAAVTSLCLAISSWSSTNEQASLGSIYLVGFQLPLSGVLLPLPIFLNWIIPPLISAYWAWSAYLQTIKSTRFFDLVHAVTETSIANSYASTWVLASHLVIGLFLSYLGIRRSDWR